MIPAFLIRVLNSLLKNSDPLSERREDGVSSISFRRTCIPSATLLPVLFFKGTAHAFFEKRSMAVNIHVKPLDSYRLISMRSMPICLKGALSTVGRMVFDFRGTR